MRKRLIVVLGMHRSGTSAITRGLQVLGVELGTNLMPAVEGNNPTGFWEDVDINALNIEMMAALKADWHHLAPIRTADLEALRDMGYHLRAAALLRQKTGDTSIFGFKDPRVVMLLPFWREVFSHCGFMVNYVLALRHPKSVVKSLEKRDGFDPEKSYLLWLGHVIASLSGSQGAPRIVVDYDRLMYSPERELERIAARFGLNLSEVDLQVFKSDFLEESLRHTVFNQEDLLQDEAAHSLVNEIFTSLRDAAADMINIDDSFSLGLKSWEKEFGRLTPTLAMIDRIYLRNTHANQAASEMAGKIVSIERELQKYQEQAEKFSHHVSSQQESLKLAQAHIVQQDAELQKYREQAEEFSRHVSSLQIQIENQHSELMDLKNIRAEELGSIKFLLRKVVGNICAKIFFRGKNE